MVRSSLLPVFRLSRQDLLEELIIRHSTLLELSPQRRQHLVQRWLRDDFFNDLRSISGGIFPHSRRALVQFRLRLRRNIDAKHHKITSSTILTYHLDLNIALPPAP